MPTPISPLSLALRLLKIEASSARADRAGNKTGAEQQNQANQVGEQLASAPSALRSLRSRLRVLRAQDGRLSGSKALRLFIEAALLNEFGSEMQLDPAFAELVERTCQAIENDASAAALLADALNELSDLSAG